MTADRRGVAACALVAAFLVGGVAQAELWRLVSVAPRSPIETLVGVVCSQFCWALTCFAVAVAAARGRVRDGIAWGAATGLALIVSYYACQWIFYDKHAATSQFNVANGPAWVIGSVLAGAGLGLFAGLASRREASALTGLGWAAPALAIGIGPTVWAGDIHYVPAGQHHTIPVVYALVALALLAIAVRRCGVRAASLGLLLGAGVAAVGLAGLYWAETHGVLYQTF